MTKEQVLKDLVEACRTTSDVRDFQREAEKIVEKSFEAWSTVVSIRNAYETELRTRPSRYNRKAHGE